MHSTNTDSNLRLVPDSRTSPAMSNPSRRLYLRDCSAGDVVEDVYVISGKQFSATQNGKFFIKAFVSDRSSQITARMWNATRDIFNAIPDSGFMRVRGRVENYQNNLQFIIEQVWPAKDGTFAIDDLMPRSLAASRTVTWPRSCRRTSMTTI